MRWLALSSCFACPTASDQDHMPTLLCCWCGVVFVMLVAPLQLGDVAAFEGQLRQLLATGASHTQPPSSSGSVQGIPAVLLDKAALSSSAQGPQPTTMPLPAAPGFQPSAPQAAAIPAIGAAADGGGLWLVGTGAMEADVDLVLEAYDKISSLLLNLQVRQWGLCCPRANLTTLSQGAAFSLVL